MRYEQHCASSLEKLGEEFGEVHEWLDYYRGKKLESYDFTIPPPCRHWVMRHHEEGLVECMEHFSKLYDSNYVTKIIEAAKLHIMDDCKSVIPKKKDYDEYCYLINPEYLKKVAQASTVWMD